MDVLQVSPPLGGRERWNRNPFSNHVDKQLRCTLILPTVSAPVEIWDKIMAVITRGAFLCYKYAATQMIKLGRGGIIIGASSIGGKQGDLGRPFRICVILIAEIGPAQLAAYSASKFADRGLTQAAGHFNGQVIRATFNLMSSQRSNWARMAST
jgi:NAD(P)-dependent dehydrogenase (short-subunit alcohol dehydrogenase family)